LAGERLQVLPSPQPVVIGAGGAPHLSDRARINTAAAAMGMPVMGALAPALGADPVALMAAAALGSALGFMLPVGTPPNAMAFGTGLVPARVMMRAGVLADLLGAVAITAAISWWR
jgi:sodium-dependent dicarboxylate transporter 2/3/5